MINLLKRVGQVLIPFRESLMTIGFVGLVFICLDGFMVSSSLSNQMNIASDFPNEIVLLLIITFIFLNVTWLVVRKFLKN